VPDYYSVKEAIFPFAKFQGVDPILGPEMRSTGEVMGVGRTFNAAFARAQEAGGIKAPPVGKAFVSVRDPDKKRVLPVAKALLARGYSLVATRGTAAWLQQHGMDCEIINKVVEGRPHIVDSIKNGEIVYIVNTTEGRSAINDSFSIRREAAASRHLLDHHCRRQGAGGFTGIPRHRPRLVAAGAAQGVECMRAPITMKGAQKLRDELDHLKSVKRPKVIAAIAEAREHGDLKENAEYHAAREEQGFIEGRIKQLEGELSHAEIIDVSKLNAGSKVVFGASVTLADVETDEEKKYQIVGDLEADIKLGLIAISSPVARAMIGKLEGDSIVIDAPAGQREYEIVSVSYVD
jgi:transcription elongation factor GreA